MRAAAALFAALAVAMIVMLEGARQLSPRRAPVPPPAPTATSGGAPAPGPVDQAPRSHAAPWTTLTMR